MHIPKRYGMSKVDVCPFCQKQTTTTNSQKVPVCSLHKQETLDNFKCVCGSTLDLLHGKFGVFFSCMRCGAISMKKALEFNTLTPRAAKEASPQNVTSHSQTRSYTNSSSQRQPNDRKEITIRSDDPDYF